MTSPTSTSTPETSPDANPDANAEQSPHQSPDRGPAAAAGPTPGPAPAPVAPPEGPAGAPAPPAPRTRAHVHGLRRRSGTTARTGGVGGVGAALRSAAGTGRRGFDHARSGLASLVWTAALLAAGVLLLGLVLVVAEANTRNALVEWVLRTADVLDLGVFGRDTGVKHFTGEGAAVKNAVVNWGLGAIAWLVVGRVARRLLTLGAG